MEPGLYVYIPNGYETITVVRTNKEYADRLGRLVCEVEGIDVSGLIDTFIIRIASWERVL